jgi:Flp pilus assembly protein TadB
VASGAALKFKPLIWGGIVCNLVGIAAIFIAYTYHPLFVILGIVAADLIPGYILRNKSKKSYA